MREHRGIQAVVDLKANYYPYFYINVRKQRDLFVLAPGKN
ncbi:hypothetical protein J2Y03_003665 [Neobacillus niacini]|nr:hypothetical protein [Neobacillus niacini]